MASALPSFTPAHIATCRRKSDPQNGTHGPPEQAARAYSKGR